MEIFSAEINLGGDIRNSVVIHLLTVPELEVLRRVHGHDAIWNISKTGEDATIENDHERETLQLKYGPEVVSTTFGPYGQLPTKFTELKIPEAQVKSLDLPAVTSKIERKPADSYGGTK